MLSHWERALLANGPKGLALRIRECAELAGSGDQLAILTGIPRRTLESYLSGGVEPKAGKLHRICAAVGVDGHWLLTGEEPKFRPGSSGAVADDGDFVRVPHFSGQRAEPPSVSISFSRAWLLENGFPPSGLIYLNMPDDSMGETIRSGSLIVAQCQDDCPRTDGIYVLMRDHQVAVKRLQFNFDGSCGILSDNTVYEDQLISADALAALQVVGKVFFAGRML